MGMHLACLKQKLETGKRKNNVSSAGSRHRSSCHAFNSAAARHQPADESFMIFTEAFSSVLLPLGTFACVLLSVRLPVPAHSIRDEQSLRLRQKLSLSSDIIKYYFSISYDITRNIRLCLTTTQTFPNFIIA